eukprot:gene13804-biopygen23074
MRASPLRRCICYIYTRAAPAARTFAHFPQGAPDPGAAGRHPLAGVPAGRVLNSALRPGSRKRPFGPSGPWPRGPGTSGAEFCPTAGFPKTSIWAPGAVACGPGTPGAVFCPRA